MNRMMISLVVVAVMFAMAISGCTTKDITSDAVMENPGDDIDDGLIVQTPDDAVDVQPAEPVKQTEPAQPADAYGVECSSDADCGETVYGEKYCFQNGVVTPVTRRVCMNPGSIKSYCRGDNKDQVEMCETGREVCRQAKCLVLAEQPCTDSDGGKDYFEAGKVFDAELIEYKDNCVDKHTVIEYYCSGGTKGLARSEEHSCMGGDCVTGACTED